MLTKRYGEAMNDRLATMFAEAGLPFKRDLDKVPNSRRSLMLGELARDRGLHGELHPRLFDVYWSRGRDLGDERVLIEEGVAVGLEEEQIREVLGDDGYLGRVVAQTEAAVGRGVAGVPAWVIDERLLVPGAQPHEVFDQVMQRLEHQPAGDDAGYPPS